MEAIAMGSKSLVLDFLHAGRLESAWDMIKNNNISRNELNYHKAFKDLDGKIRYATTNGDIRNVNRLKRRIQSLKAFREHGFVPRKLIASVDLHEGYHGKILLVRVVVGRANGRVCLRSGDDWHREILQNTKEEIQDLGFENSKVVPMGGAWIRFDSEGAIIVYGSSDEFGTCDKEMAAHLIESAFPGKKILTRP